jgi:hypothetical protein
MRTGVAAGCLALVGALGLTPVIGGTAEATSAPATLSPVRSLGTAQGPALRTVPAQPVAAGRSEEAFPYRPLTHRQIPGRVPTDAGSIQTSAPEPSAAATGTTFEGQGNADLVLPSDANGDIGYDSAGNAWYVQWVNLHFAIFERVAGTSTWTKKGAWTGDTLFANLNNPCSYDNNGDPVVQYDQYAHRWVLAQFAFDSDWLFGTPIPPYGECVAVSKTDNPFTGGWYQYSWDMGGFNGTDYFPDYPKLSVWPDGYYLSFNYFSGNNLQNFDGSGIAILERPRMLTGDASARALATGPIGAQYGGLLPADPDGPTPPTGPETFVAADTSTAPNGSTLQFWHSTANWGSSASGTFGVSGYQPNATLPVATYDWYLCAGSRNCIPQPGTNARLDTLSDRLMYRAAYRVLADGSEHLVLNHTVNVSQSGGNQAGIRWYDVRNPSTTPTLGQQGTYAPDATNRWMGSAAMDAAGDIAIGYSASSSSLFPSLRYAVRTPGEPAGTLEAEQVLWAGSGSQTSSTNRWGDYTSLSVDPVDDCTFWFTGQYYAATASYDWHTRIGSFSVPGCGSVTPPDPPTAPTAVASAVDSSHIDVSWSGSTGATSYDVLRGGVAVASGLSSSTSVFHDSGLSPSTTYSYQVRAVNAGGSTLSNTATATTAAAPVSVPATPTGLTAKAQSGPKVTLNWSLSTGATYYRVTRDGVQIGQPTAPPYEDTGVATSTRYTYGVAACNSAGCSSAATVKVRTTRR